MENKVSFYVIVEDINAKKFVQYDIMPYLVRCYNEEENKPTTFEEFKLFITNKSRYRWWSRCEYEIILKSWPTGRVEEKWDVHRQVMMNIDTITELLIEACDEF